MSTGEAIVRMPSKELIAKLEAATEGSWKLDVEVAHTVGHAVQVDVKGSTDILFLPEYPTGGYRCNPLRYTQSIDAAMSVLPTSSDYQQGSAKLARLYWAEVFTPGGFQKFTVKAPTPALALCIAALKAREF